MQQYNAAEKFDGDRVARELSKEEYYHGLLPREDMLSLLRRNGEFLIRYSEARKGEKSFILSMMLNEHIGKEGLKHFIISRTPSGKYVIEKFGFTTIPEMVAFHLKGTPVTKKGGVCLLFPVMRQPWEHAHENITVGKKLGEGAFGEVSLGTLKIRTANKVAKSTTNHNATGKTTTSKASAEYIEVAVAIKLAKMETVTKEQIKEIMTEARLMRRFDHPNVVKFYGVATLQEPLMVLMEVCSEGALDSYLKKVKQPPEKLTEMMIQAAWGLEYIHRHNVLHRDIAARNCLYGNNNVKIADFGLSREGTSFQMEPHSRVPIRWLAPEVLSTACFTQKTDVWAYGIMVWEIYSDGAEPYPAMSVADVARQVVIGYRYPYPDAVRNEVKEFLMSSVLSGTPQQRPTMAEVVAKWKDFFPRMVAPLK